ncbi:MAG: IS200/IS605 family transposase [Promethearchaeota archaeon]
MQYQKEVHKVYSLYYHVIFVVKYRQKVFLEGHDIVSDAKERMVEWSGGHDVEIVEVECGIDHVHLLIGAKPTLDIPKWINSVKGNTSRFLREKHAGFLRDKLWGDHFWSPSYFIVTTGNVSINALKQYIEEQRGRLARAD